MNPLSFFRKSAPSAPFAGDDAARMKLYRKLRFQSFIAGTVGYSLYYVCRTSLNVVKKPILESGALDATQLGIIGSALLFAYAIGKFVNGFLSDHSNIKRFMAAGLCVSAVANLLAGRINKELPEIDRKNVFVYTFATPVALTAASYPDYQLDYDNNHNADGSLKESWGESNIFNIISSGDIVPHLLPEEWSFHRNGNDRFLPSTRNEEELEDLNEMGKNDFGPTPLDFSWLATDKETDEVMLRMEEYFISRENYHEKYEAALMDMIQCAFIRSEEEVTQNKVLDDGEVIQRLRTLTHLKNMDYWKISRAVWAASTMSRAVLKRVDAENIPIRAQQIVVPILAVGLCYGLESEAVSLIAKYILMFVAMKSAPDDAIRAAFCHHCENYIALMEYYAPSEHCMEATTRT